MATRPAAVEQDAPAVVGAGRTRPPDAFLAGAPQPHQADHLAGMHRAVDRPDLVDAGAPGPAARAPRRCAGRRKTCDGSRPTISRIASSGVVSATRGRRRRGRRAARPCGRRSRTPRRAGARRRSSPTPRALSRRSAANSRATSSAGRLAVGSSRTSTSASAASARAIATSDFSVRLRAWSACRGRYRRRARPARARRAPRAPPVDQAEAARIAERQADVLGHRHPVDEAEVLMDEGDRQAAQRAGDVAAAKATLPASSAWTPARILISVDLPAPFSPAAQGSRRR